MDITQSCSEENQNHKKIQKSQKNFYFSSGSIVYYIKGDNKRMKANKKYKANRRYKDSVFRSIFNNSPTILELYNAIKGTNYKDESMIEVNTLKDVLFTTIQNDLSFSINKKIEKDND